MRVAALMLMDGKVVLARHRAGDAVYHLLPGGGVDYRETIEAALLREIAEETGLQARLVRPLLINDTIDPDGARHLVNLTFLAEVAGGTITDEPDDDRVEAIDLVDPADLTSLDLRPPIGEALQRLLAGDSSECEYLGSLFVPDRSTRAGTNLT